ncbi:MAG TPA: response regulator transcription factor [Bacteroidia bacterium]|nr:response regulator transcription factor [Bacteroidia bacterium]
MTPTNPRMLLVDDFALLREGMKLVLQNQYSNAVFGEAGSVPKALEELRNKKWDILITDITMPGRDGIELIEQMRTEGMNIPALVVSMHPDDHMALRAFKAGASGYLPKNVPNSEVLDAVETILHGKKYITASAAEKLLQQFETPENKKPHEILSNREFSTAMLMASGKTVSQISEDLSLSITTVSTYRARILQKMKMKTSAELVSYFIRYVLNPN